MNHLAIRRTWLVWRGDIAAAVLLLVFVVLAFEGPALLIEGHF